MHINLTLIEVLRPAMSASVSFPWIKNTNARELKECCIFVPIVPITIKWNYIWRKGIITCWRVKTYRYPLFYHSSSHSQLLLLVLWWMFWFSIRHQTCSLVAMIMIIMNNDCIERCNWRFLQTPHCTTSCLQYVHSSVIIHKSCTTHWVFIKGKILCATWYKGPAQLLNLTGFK